MLISTISVTLLAAFVVINTKRTNSRQSVSPCCPRALLAQYNLAAVASDVRRNDLVHRETIMWRYHEAAATLAVYHMLLDT